MGNCGLKPKVLSETGAPAPEELEISLLEDQKINAAKSLINLFLQDKADKTMKEDEKVTPEKIPVTEDLKTALPEAESSVKETKTPVTGPKAPAVVNEEAVHGQKVIGDATVKETETEAKSEEVSREAQAQ